LLIAADEEFGRIAGIGIVFGSTQHLTSSSRARSNRFALTHNSLMRAAFAIEFAGILLTAITTGVAYNYAVDGYSGSLQTYVSIGSIVALAYCMAFLVRSEYGIDSLLAGYRTPGHLFFVWNLVFIALAAIGFLTNGTQTDSRGWLVLFYFAGFAAILILNAAIVRGLGHLISLGRVRARRLMVIATETDFALLEQEIASSGPGATVAARVTIEKAGPDPDEIKKALDAAVANARAIGVEDVFISDALSRHPFLERIIQAFSALPVAVHLSAGKVVGRFKHAHAVRGGPGAVPSPVRLATKRRFDVAVSAIALVLLSPLFAVIALLIKCDSRGPVFFKQWRRGYNKTGYGIWKFRTITTLGDGHAVRQVRKGDWHVTSIGTFLRHFSLDKLPQLINIFKGEMSLVGPPPPAARHDIFYIDNCRPEFDLHILLLTSISPRTNRNAWREE
jgi:lipopolysaccharide/colanic/teichoic acid biosynthesis glycosyltransferase